MKIYEQTPAPVAFLHGRMKYERSSQKHTFYNVLGAYLALVKGPHTFIHLTVLDIPISKGTTRFIDKNLVHTSVLWQFIERQKTQGKFQSIQQSQLDLIRKHNAGYLIYSKRAVIAPELQGLIKERIIDENTGEVFGVLKKSDAN